MPKTQKSVLPQHLEKYTVLVEDTDSSSRYFRLAEVPDVLTGGKNAFLINGSKELNPATEVKIEIKDSQGNTVFLQPVRNYQEGLARVISIEVYEDTPPGEATLTVMGELRITAEGRPIPPEWIGKYNVRWQKKINIQPTALNRTKVRLYDRPEITATEILVPYLSPITSSYVLYSGSFDTRKVQTSVFPSLPYSVTRKELAPTQTQVAFYVTNPSPYFPFVRDMEGGTLLFQSTSIAYDKPGGGFNYVPQEPYLATVIRVLNSSSLQLSTASLGPYTALNLWGTMSYQPPPAFGGSQLTRSFADVRISKMTTFSGDVSRAKIYAKSVEQGGTYQLIEDRRIEAVGLLLTSSISGERDIPIGKFNNAAVLSNYWQAGYYDSVTGYSINPAVVMDYSSARIIDGVYKTGTTTTPYFFGVKTPLSFIGLHEYTFRGSLLCYKSDPNLTSVCGVYLSGSAFPTDNALGVLVQTFSVNPGKDGTLFDSVTFNFNGLADGTATLNFVVDGGEWHFADISIDSAAETGFNPDEIRISALITGRRFERLMFKAELLDPNSNLVPVTVESVPYYFDGGNAVFRGQDHRIEGVMTLAPSGSNTRQTTIRLTTGGFLDNNLNQRSGSAIVIGEGYIFNPNTPIFLGTDDSGSATFSLSDKLWARTDPVTGLFILDIFGTVYVGSGSNRTDIRTLLPRQNSDGYYNRLRGDVLDMQDVRGTRAVSAGAWNAQMARMGYYTRGSDGFNNQTPFNMDSVVKTMDPFATASMVITSSKFLTVPAGQQIYNGTMYGDLNVGVQEGGIVSGLYLLTYKLEVIASWTGYLTGSAQTMFDVGSTYVAVQGSFSPDPIVKYPIFIPADRGNSNTLYITLRLTVNTTPQ